MYGTKSPSYVKVKCWVESEDFHSPGSVTFIPESIYMHNTPDAAESNKQSGLSRFPVKMFIWIFIASAELTAESKPATQYTIDANQEVYVLLDFEDTMEFENATKGLLCSYR